MSHIVEIQTQVRDPVAVEASCNRMGLAKPTAGRFQLFSEEVEGLGVQLPAWVYPVVCQLKTGTLRYDNYGGLWGEQRHLDRFLQSYAVEKSKLEARRKGHTVTEQSLPDGSIKLTVTLGGQS